MANVYTAYYSCANCIATYMYLDKIESLRGFLDNYVIVGPMKCLADFNASIRTSNVLPISYTPV